MTGRPLVQAISVGILIVCGGPSLGQNAQPSAQETSPSLKAELILDPPAHFAVTGFKGRPAKDLERVFQITVHRSDLEDLPAMLGTYSYDAGTLRFQPRYPLSPSVVYEMRWGAEWSKRPEEPGELLFELPKPPARPAARITKVYPSGDELPENLLKFYIHFSEPMSRGEAYRWIQLFQGDELVDQPFLELGEELWDGEQTRFTLFLHPGRIKRGLKPNQEQGPPMVSGHRYTLKISRQWKAADGRPLDADYERSFRVGPPDRGQLDPEAWQIETPARDSAQAVALVFDEPLDHAMLERVLAVKNRLGETVPGRVSIADDETKWLFTPNENWKVGTYHIEIAANLEDRSGNSIARPFEVKMQERAAAQPTTKIAVEFVVK